LKAGGDFGTGLSDTLGRWANHFNVLRREFESDRQDGRRALLSRSSLAVPRRYDQRQTQGPVKTATELMTNVQGVRDRFQQWG
jgi:hypothetical protein